ncbi:MAG: 2-dehydro-3-deoxy-6-phosphogalactonate aldolase [Massilia sp.]
MNLDSFAPPLVAILRGLPPADAPSIGATLFAAGFRLLEVPLNRPGALEAIAALARIAPEGALVGGGTILSPADVDAVKAAGGRMFVSPHCDQELIRYAHAAGMLCLPGVATPSEAFAALRAGAHGLKLFPAESIGYAGLRALKTVLPPGTAVWPVGGVRPEHMGEWVAAGATGFGIGSALYQPGMAAADLAPVARRYIEAWNTAQAGAGPNLKD